MLEHVHSENQGVLLLEPGSFERTSMHGDGFEPLLCFADHRRRHFESDRIKTSFAQQINQAPVGAAELQHGCRRLLVSEDPAQPGERPFGQVRARALGQGGQAVQARHPVLPVARAIKAGLVVPDFEVMLREGGMSRDQGCALGAAAVLASEIFKVTAAAPARVHELVSTPAQSVIPQSPA